MSRLPDTTVELWDEAVDRLFAGLNPHDPEDRATFRTALVRHARHTRVSLLRDLARHYGATGVEDNENNGPAIGIIVACVVGAMCWIALLQAGIRAIAMLG